VEATTHAIRTDADALQSIHSHALVRRERVHANVGAHLMELGAELGVPTDLSAVVESKLLTKEDGMILGNQGISTPRHS